MKRLLALLLLPTACGHAPAKAVAPAPPPPPPTAAQQLGQLSSEYWAELIKRSPLWATDLGDHSRDGELDDASASAEETHLAVLGGLRGRLSRLDRTSMDEKDRVTAQVLDVDLEGELTVARACKTWLWAVDQLDGPQVTLARLPEIQPVTDEKSAADLASRYRKIAGMYREIVVNLRAGMEQGLLPARINVERVLSQLDDLLAKPSESSAFMEVKLPAAWPAQQQEKTKGLLLAAVKEGPYPGMEAYRAFLRNELLPKARGQVGVSAIPGGAACYAAHIQAETGLSKSAEEIHQLGLSEVKRIESLMQELASKAHVRNAKLYLSRLTAREDEHVATRQELEARATEILKKALAALPGAFGTLPRTPIEVKAIDSWQEKDAPAAYYFQAPTDGSRPAYFRLNTYEPGTRPLFSLPALTFHEAVPGHHLQIALQNESGDLPTFRQQIGQTAFTEGWALYAEGLADELGLYRNPGEEMGRLNYELWRAVRLVVDTGIHAKGWSREQAIRYFKDHTGNPRNEIENEVDRYIEWPGQALAYKVGELEIRRLRAQAQAQLGPKFDLKKFHEVVLSAGSTPLSVLSERVDRWLAASR